MNNFTDQEVKSAKATRDAIINEEISELQSVYMAGEICMWDEMRAEIERLRSTLKLLSNECDNSGCSEGGMITRPKWMNKTIKEALNPNI